MEEQLKDLNVILIESKFLYGNSREAIGTTIKIFGSFLLIPFSQTQS